MPRRLKPGSYSTRVEFQWSPDVRVSYMVRYVVEHDFFKRRDVADVEQVEAQTINGTEPSNWELLAYQYGGLVASGNMPKLAEQVLAQHARQFDGHPEAAAERAAAKHLRRQSPCVAVLAADAAGCR